MGACYQAWAGLEVSAVTSTGNLKQLYPTWCPAGVDPASATAGQSIRNPGNGEIYRVEVIPDGMNAGTIEIWDLSGVDVGANVSSADVVTNSQLTELQTAGKAKLLWSRAFAGDAGVQIINEIKTAFLHGLAARFVASAGICTLHISASHGYYLTEKRG